MRTTLRTLAALGGTVMPGELRGDLAEAAVIAAGGNGFDGVLAVQLVAMRAGRPDAALQILDRLCADESLDADLRPWAAVFRRQAAQLAWQRMPGGGGTFGWSSECGARRPSVQDIVDFQRLCPAGTPMAPELGPHCALAEYWDAVADVEGSTTSTGSIFAETVMLSSSELAGDFDYVEALAQKLTALRYSAAQHDNPAIKLLAERALAQHAFRCGKDEASEALERVTAAAEANDELGYVLCLLRQVDWLLAPLGGAQVLDLAVVPGSLMSYVSGSTADSRQLSRMVPQADVIEQAARRLLGEAGVIVARRRAAGHADTGCAEGVLTLHRSWLALRDSRYADQAAEAQSAYEAFAGAGDAYGQHLARIHQLVACIGLNPNSEPVAPIEEIAHWALGGGSFSWAVGLASMLGRIGWHWHHRARDLARARRAYQWAQKLYWALGATISAAQIMVDHAACLGDIGLSHDELDLYEQAAGVWKAVADGGHPAHPSNGHVSPDLIQFQLALAIRNVGVRDRSASVVKRAAVLATRLESVAGPSGPNLETWQLIERGQRALADGEPEIAYEAFAEAHTELVSNPHGMSALQLLQLGYSARDFGMAYRSLDHIIANSDFDAMAAHLPQGDPALLRQLSQQGDKGRLAAEAATLSVLDRMVEAADRIDQLNRQLGPDWWRSQETPWLERALIARVEALRPGGDAAKAEEMFDEALELLEQARSRGSDDVERRAFSSNSAVRTACHDAAFLTVEAGRLPVSERAKRAFHLLEQGRARALLDLQVSNRALSSAPPEVQEEIRLLRRFRALREAQPGNTAAEQEITEITRRLLRDWPDYAQLAHPAVNCPDADEILRLLPDGVVLITWAVQGPKVLVVAVRADGNQQAEFSVALTGWDRFPLWSAVWTKCATDPDFDAQDGTAAGRMLAEVLLKPFTTLLDGAHAIVLVPDNLTVQAPLHILPYLDGCLIDYFDVTYLPSAAVIANIGDASSYANPCTPTALVVGNPARMMFVGNDSNVSASPLPFAEAEAEQVAKRCGTKALTQHAATAEAVMSLLKNAKLIHLATHGHLDPLDPARSLILLADGASINAESLMIEALNADMVVLSACHSGIGRRTYGGETLGLARFLLAAGVRTVVVSMWTAYDPTTERIMHDFYRYLPDTGPARAMALAQRRIKKLTYLDQLTEYEAAGGPPQGPHVQRRDLNPSHESSQDTLHPCFWAPFIIIGMPL